MRFLLFVVMGLVAGLPLASAKSPEIKAEKLGAPVAAAPLPEGKNDGKPMPMETQAQLLCEAYKIMNAHTSATYQEGVDAYGRPVAPASGDAAAQGFSVPDEVQIPMTIDFAKYVGLTVPTGAELKGNVGTIAVRSDGQVSFNGQNSTDTLRNFCKTVQSVDDKTTK